MSIPVYEADLFTDEALTDPYDHYRALRDAGPVVWLAAHVAFGYGQHACAGMGLARLEGAAVLTTLVERVQRIEHAGEPQRKLNKLIRSFRSLPVAVQAA